MLARLDRCAMRVFLIIICVTGLYLGGLHSRLLPTEFTTVTLSTKPPTETPTKTLTETPTKTPRTISLVHIPKTAGTSLYTQFKHRVKFRHHSPGNDERTLSYYKRNFPGDTLATFFRDPGRHVWSQYLECRYDAWGRRVTAGTGFPRHSNESEITGYTPGFDEWLEHFVSDPHTQNMFNCYQPLNMQTRHMGTSNDTAHGWQGDGLELTDSIRTSIRELDFLGITEHYTLSACMFEFMVVGTFGEHCICDNISAPKKPSREIKITHGVPPHHFGSLSKYTLDMIEQLTLEDTKLYRFAISEFKRRVQLFETSTGVTLCGSKDIKII